MSRSNPCKNRTESEIELSPSAGPSKAIEPPSKHKHVYDCERIPSRKNPPTPEEERASLSGSTVTSGSSSVTANIAQLILKRQEQYTLDHMHQEQELALQKEQHQLARDQFQLAKDTLVEQGHQQESNERIATALLKELIGAIGNVINNKGIGQKKQEEENEE